MTIIKKYKDFINEGRVPKDERIKLLDDDDYLIVVPLTNKASFKYGAFTKWCVSAPSNNDMQVQKDGINTINGENFLIFLLNKKHKHTTSDISDEYKELHSACATGDIPYSELTKFVDEHGLSIYDLSKIAFEYKIDQDEHNIWSANNIDMTEDDYNIDNLEKVNIKKYATDIIKNYINNIINN